MSYHPIPVENNPADRAQIARVLVTAFYEDIYYRTVYQFSPLPFLIENAGLRIGSNLLSERGWFMKIVLTEEDKDDGKGKGEIVSYAKWTLPVDVKERLEKEHQRMKLGERELEELGAMRRMGCDANGEPKGLNDKMIEVVGEAMERARTALPSGRPHMDLDMIATLPSHQRRGIATAHLKWGLNLADRERLLVFLESTPTGKGLYEKFGFKEVSRATHDLPKWGGEGLYTHVFMMREPEVVQG